MQQEVKFESFLECPKCGSTSFVEQSMRNQTAKCQECDKKIRFDEFN